MQQRRSRILGNKSAKPKSKSTEKRKNLIDTKVLKEEQGREKQLGHVHACNKMD